MTCDLPACHKTLLQNRVLCLCFLLVLYLNPKLLSVWLADSQYSSVAQHLASSVCFSLVTSCSPKVLQCLGLVCTWSFHWQLALAACTVYAAACIAGCIKAPVFKSKAMVIRALGVYVKCAVAGPESEDLSRQPSSMVDGFENFHNDDNISESGYPGKSPRLSETSEPSSQ